MSCARLRGDARDDGSRHDQHDGESRHRAQEAENRLALDGFRLRRLSRQRGEAATFDLAQESWIVEFARDAGQFGGVVRSDVGEGVPRVYGGLVRTAPRELARIARELERRLRG